MAPTTGIAPMDDHFANPGTIRVPESVPRPLEVTPFELPEIADLPSPGSVVRRGHPVCTVFARGQDDTVCLSKLKAAAKKTLERFVPATGDRANLKR